MKHLYSLLKCGAALLAVVLLHADAQASVQTLVTAGGVVQVGAPASVVNDATPGLYVFQEQDGLVTAGGTLLDQTSAGTANFTNSFKPSSGVLGAGTYDSFLVNFDPLGVDTTTGLQTITFENGIVGIIMTQSAGSHLSASDAVFGAGGTTYPTAGDDPFGKRELEGFSVVTDTLTFNGGKTITFNLRDTTFDQIRVITATVPEPASMLIMAGGFGIAGIAALRRRKAKA